MRLSLGIVGENHSTEGTWPVRAGREARQVKVELHESNGFL